jgi:hypothetical protein
MHPAGPYFLVGVPFATQPSPPASHCDEVLHPSTTRFQQQQQRGGGGPGGGARRSARCRPATTCRPRLPFPTKAEFHQSTGTSPAPLCVVFHAHSMSERARKAGQSTPTSSISGAGAGGASSAPTAAAGSASKGSSMMNRDIGYGGRSTPAAPYPPAPA